MALDLNTQKRICEESCIPSKRQRLEKIFCSENLQTDILNPLNDTSHALSDMSSTIDLTPTILSEAKTGRIPSSLPLIIYDDNASFPQDFTSANDFLNEFFTDIRLQKAKPCNDQTQEPSSSMDSVNEEIHIIPIPEICENEPAHSITKYPTCTEEVLTQSSNKTHVIQEIQSISPFKNESSNHRVNNNNSRSSKNRMTSYKTVLPTELGNSIFISLKLHNNQYYIYIKHDGSNRQSISSKNGIGMNIKCWYEFQIKINAFNLKYVSSSFVVNNMILVLNNNNLSMSIKNLKNYSYIELDAHQLENLKTIIPDFNKKLLHHMYAIHLPYLIKRECIPRSSSLEETLSASKILYTCIEENLKSILNRMYECATCILGNQSLSKSFHPCSMFSIREKYDQLGVRVLMLANFDFIVATFSNRVHYIDECFLSNINVESIHNVLFNSIN